jgi:bis(5'-nucleosidyl)-tetraphosphatase
VQREISAGAVVVRRMRGRWWLAAIVPGGRPDVLALPKGLVERGESTVATALREVREETGLTATPVADLGTIRYVYVRQEMRIFKLVTFHLLRATAGRLGAIEPAMRIEVQRALWLPLEEHGRLSYRGEREVAGRALDHLSG